MANAPIAMPTPVASAPSGPAANRDETGSTTPPDVKNTSAAANSAPNAGVNSRGAVVIGRPASELGEQSVGGGVRIEPVGRDLGEDRFRGGSAFRRSPATRAAARRGSPRPAASARASRAPPPSSSRPVARCRSSAASSSGTPSPVEAVVTMTSGRFGAGRSGPAGSAPTVGTSIARSWAAVRSAPGLSPLLTTTRSATSSRPALIAWTSSPISGASRTTVVSAAAATSTSLWPVPTVSMSTRSNPAASSTAAAAVVVEARPPAWPRDAIERMNTSGSPAYDCIRTRSPSSAPPVIGDDGSTATTATARPAARTTADQRRDERRLAGARRAGDAHQVGLAGDRVQPAQGGLGDGVRFSTAVRSRASARRSPAIAASASSVAPVVAWGWRPPPP